MSDYPTLISATIQPARKRHRCDDCHSTIEVGEVYRRVCLVYLVYDASKYTWKRCVPCQEWFPVLDRLAGGYFEYEAGRLGEALEYYADVDEDGWYTVKPKGPSGAG